LESKERGLWPIAKIVELETVREGEPRTAKILLKGRIFRRAVISLGELRGINTPFEDIEKGVNGLIESAESEHVPINTGEKERSIKETTKSEPLTVKTGVDDN
jgi:hypothetical protein